MSRTEWGWGPIQAQALQELGRPEGSAHVEGPAPATELRWSRVIEELRGEYRVIGDTEEIPSVLPGKWRKSSRIVPAVGDWVGLETAKVDGRTLIAEVLPRRNKLSRQAAGETVEEQVLAANLDRVFVLTSLNEDLNARRLERFFAIIFESGAAATLLFTKKDLCQDLTLAHELVRALKSVDHEFLSVNDPASFARVQARLRPGQTAALMGSSGVGKSTLINALLGRDAQKTFEVRTDDAKGRHTTTSRRMFRLPTGELFIDMPGVREVQLWKANEGVRETFEDIKELSLRCKFTNCTHFNEKNCAVRAAIEDGRVTRDRLEAYRKLLGELKGFKKPRNPPKLKG